MSFTKNESYITAAELNAINANARHETQCPTFGKSQLFQWYSHRPAGALLCSLRIDCGWFAGVHIYLYRIDPATGNVLSTLYDANHGWMTHFTLNINSQGPGYYKLTTSEAYIDEKTWYFYWGQTGCAKGEYLTLYDDPAVSGNRLIGSYLTADLLNAGRGGTIPKLS